TNCRTNDKRKCREIGDKMATRLENLEIYLLRQELLKLGKIEELAKINEILLEEAKSKKGE
ncbi:MAG: hypothetical protein FWF50_02650, partial [Defluviitaleaceae bacterium]|nr:hypothetical protein [Defluviitaleaceae bacterium]